MHARPWIVVGVLGLAVVAGASPKGAAKGDPSPTRIDPRPSADQLIVLQDSAGGTYVVHEPTTSSYRLWFGTGKALHEQITIGRSRDGDSWILSVWAPRISGVRPGLVQKRKDGSFSKACDGHDDAELTELTGAKAAAVLAKSELMTAALIRRPHLLARDDRGVYYYVDKLSIKLGGKGFRVFVGKKGAMKQLALVDVASDTMGEVFSTKTGDLRLIAVPDRDVDRKATWLKGERRTELVSLDVNANSRLIFTDLGIYTFLGSICDNV